MPTKKIIALSGSSGLVGSKLSLALKKAGYEIWPLVRTNYPLGPGQIAYDYRHNFIESDKLKKCHAVIHLAGKNIMSGLWTKKVKQELYDSRVLSTRLIAKAMAESGPKILLCASAVGIYGDQDAKVLDENAPHGDDFLAELCQDWELATKDAELAGARVVNMRFGIIISKDGGMLKGLLPLFKRGMGAYLGTGKQFISVVAIDDVIAAILFALANDDLQGPINVCAPASITNEDFTKALSDKYKRRSFLRAPVSILKLLGEQSSLFLSSTRAIPKALLEKNFTFKKINFSQMIEDI